ncbi:MAG: ABC transporter ATP-binding protein [Clostridium sp.]|nr:ABC transporter ATP-binding protein [Clostridium sp.]
MASLSLKHVWKKYPNGFEAVKDFNLEIEDKELIAFVGPSGCGKSTILRMIAGLEDISSGEVYIDGRLVNNVDPKDREIAMVLQNCTLYPQMTVRENLSFALKLGRIPEDEIECRVNETAENLDLTQLMDRTPEQLSDDQRQRVAMGRAVVRNPKVLLLDEPLFHLDEKLKDRMRMELAALQRKLGITIIYVTHDQAEAMAMAARIVVMKDGAIQQVDSPQNLYNYPENKFVAGFIGGPQMNLIDAMAEKGTSGVTLNFAGSVISLSEEKATLLEEKGYLNREITLGIRPEDIHEEKDAVESAGDCTIKADILACEMQGEETFLTFDIGDSSCSARVNPATAAGTGDVVKFALDINKIHLFDKETGLVIR